MKFSILVPVYNIEKYLRQCLDSIIAQTYKDYEAVLVDDGSEDRSGMICDEYQEKYPDKIRVIHKKNSGVLSARIEGIKEAKGDYCVFTDSDDFVEPDMLETINEYISKDNNIDILIYSFRYYIDGEKAQRYPAFYEDGRVWCGEEKRELYEALISTNNITTIWSKAIRRDILQSDPTDYMEHFGKNMAEDLWQSLYPITAAGKICYTDKVLYNYRYNSGGISHSYALERIKKNNTLHVYNAILAYLPKWGMDNIEIRAKLDAKWFNDAVYQFIKCYENAESKKDRELILQYDWNETLPAKEIERNEYISKTYYDIYQAWEQKKYFTVKRLLLKKKILEKIKKMKRIVRSSIINSKGLTV